MRAEWPSNCGTWVNANHRASKSDNQIARLSTENLSHACTVIEFSPRVTAKNRMLGSAPSYIPRHSIVKRLEYETMADNCDIILRLRLAYSLAYSRIY